LPRLTIAGGAAAALAAIAISLAFAVGAFDGGGDDRERSAVGDRSSAEALPEVTPMVVGGGGSPPEFAEPVLLMPGEYTPPSASREAWQKFQATLLAEADKPQFNGSVSGFRIYGWKNAVEDPSLEQAECVSSSFPEVKVLEPSYLPPGTAARSPQYAGICEDGTMAWVNQDFELPAASFSIAYELGERAIGTDATVERVSEATVAGQPGVVIHPLIEEGNGQSIVAYPLAKGFILVGAQGLPIEETLKIAGGVRCESC
jgi:hypothetical protein